MDTNKGQRTGYTTGSCATAGARAALRAITTQQTQKSIDITLPRGGTITIPVESCEFEAGVEGEKRSKRAKCTIIKDGGDDPDVTHGAKIIVELSVTDAPNEIVIMGGEGVGTVTKPGLGLEIGKPAINPVPKKMIMQNLRQEQGSEFWDAYGADITITVPDGKKLGPKTDNPRLGIIGGISILGTSGIVIPFSTASYAASIRQSLDVAVAMGERTVILTTGGRSEEFARRALHDMPDHCFVQMGDFVGYSIRECAKRAEQFEKAYVVGFIGKLAKMATGVRQTHVKGSKVDMKFLAGLAGETDAIPDGIIDEIKHANTARHVSEIIAPHRGAAAFFDLLCGNVLMHMKKHAGSDIPLDIEVVLFGFDGKILARSKSS